MGEGGTGLPETFALNSVNTWYLQIKMHLQPYLVLRLGIFSTDSKATYTFCVLLSYALTSSPISSTALSLPRSVLFRLKAEEVTHKCL